MSGNSLALLAGVIWIQQLSQLPELWQICVLLGALLISIMRKQGLLMWFYLGLSWTAIAAHWQLSHRLPATWIKQDIELQGYILSLPQSGTHHQSFDFIVVTAQQIHNLQKLRLSWYDPPTLQAGQCWKLTVRLKPPHGTLNPAGFDYETWLFANRIDATGYVRQAQPEQQDRCKTSVQRGMASWRQDIANRLEHALPDSTQTAVLKALTIGSQNGISQSQWQLYQRTGIVHLIVISGSHISLIAGLVFISLRQLWLRTGWHTISAHQFAAIGSWLAGILYGALAGFSIPTLRAVIMLSVAMLALLWQRHTTATQILQTALMIVLLIDPNSVLQSGFWLSFLAIALLLHLISGRLSFMKGWRHILLSQLVGSLGLSPLLIQYFQQCSLISPLANAIAIPVIGSLVVPLALIAVVLLYLSPSLALPLLWLCDFVLSVLNTLLEYLATWPLANLELAHPPFYSLVLAGIAVLLLTLPRGIPGRHLAFCLLLPMLATADSRPEPGELRLTLLDVGQGLATVVETHRHNVVFDTGSRMPDGLDMGAAVIQPFLRYQGIHQIDHLIISHGDNDHSGGAASLMANLPVIHISSSDARWAELASGDYCQAGQHWDWDGVSFKFLAPPASAFDKENNNSCVLQIATSHNQFLLTGDIESEAEHWLVQHYGDSLRSQIMIAPHHGSKTSSSIELLQAVQADWLFISSGYLNRFNFPHPSILQRYQQVNAHNLNTAEVGAIQIETQNDQTLIHASRHQQRRYWRLQPRTPPR